MEGIFQEKLPVEAAMIMLGARYDEEHDYYLVSELDKFVILEHHPLTKKEKEIILYEEELENLPTVGQQPAITAEQGGELVVSKILTRLFLVIIGGAVFLTAGILFL